MNGDQLLTLQDLCARWKVCLRTVFYIRRKYRKRLPAVVVAPRSIRFKPTVVEEFEKWKGAP